MDPVAIHCRTRDESVPYTSHDKEQQTTTRLRACIQLLFGAICNLGASHAKSGFDLEWTPILGSRTRKTDAPASEFSMGDSPIYTVFRLMKRAVHWLLLATVPPASAVDFDRDVRPVLSDNCYACHGPDAAVRQANLRLDVEDQARRMAREALRRVVSDDISERMPPAYLGHDKLAEADIEVLRAWVEAGAPWSAHWAFVAPVRPTLPSVRWEHRVRNPIDRFVFERLEGSGAVACTGGGSQDADSQVEPRFDRSAS